MDDCPDEQPVREMGEILGSDTEEVLVAERPDGGLSGFLEAALCPWADGCDSSPVGYIEGWYDVQDVRRRGDPGRTARHRGPPRPGALYD